MDRFQALSPVDSLNCASTVQDDPVSHFTHFDKVSLERCLVPALLCWAVLAKPAAVTGYPQALYCLPFWRPAVLSHRNGGKCA